MHPQRIAKIKSTAIAIKTFAKHKKAGGYVGTPITEMKNFRRKINANWSQIKNKVCEKWINDWQSALPMKFLIVILFKWIVFFPLSQLKFNWFPVLLNALKIAEWFIYTAEASQKYSQSNRLHVGRRTWRLYCANASEPYPIYAIHIHTINHAIA